MAWIWRYHGADGNIPTEEELPNESFTSQGDAESWLGENWQEPSEGGVTTVVRWEHDRGIYTMSLQPVECARYGVTTSLFGHSVTLSATRHTSRPRHMLAGAACGHR